MSWTFEQIQRTAATPVNVSNDEFDISARMVWTGSRVWMATSGGKIDVYDHWGEEYLDYNYYFDTHIHTLPKETIDISAEHTSPTDMCVWYDSVFILENSKLSFWNKHSGSYIGQTTVPVMCFQRMCAANGKIWLTTMGIDGNDRQRVYFYDIATDTWSYTVIPGKKQTEMRDLIDGLDGNVFITAFNEHAVKRFNTTTGAYVDTTRVNRHPYRLSVNQDKDLFVMSENGMVSKITQPAMVVSNICGTLESVDSMYDTGTHYWFFGLGAQMLRLDKSTYDAKTVLGPNVGSRITFDKYLTLGGASGAAQKGIVAPTFYYEKWNGSSLVPVTVKPYAVYYSGGFTYAARLTSLVRVNSTSVLGTAMISTGDQDYYGTLS